VENLGEMSTSIGSNHGLMVAEAGFQATRVASNSNRRAGLGVKSPAKNVTAM
jgi:hypothetical protein